MTGVDELCTTLPSLYVAAGLASSIRALTQLAAKPLLYMPPGYPVEKRSSVGLRGAIAANAGGSVPAEGNCDRPE